MSIAIEHSTVVQQLSAGYSLEGKQSGGGLLIASSELSSSHLGCIERGEGFPSLQPSSVIESPTNRQLNPYVAMLLLQEAVATQCTVIGILTILKAITKTGE